MIAYVDGQQVSAEFTFEEVFAEKMEKQEKLDKIIFYVVIVIGILMILLQNGGKKKQKRSE